MAGIDVFAGGFGSGKSEMALNWALKKSMESNKVLLADLDMVNPYFVSRSVRDQLESEGIRVIAPHNELSFSDIPSVPAEIMGLMREDNDIVIDLAGDEVGSLVMGYLHSNVPQHTQCNFYLVINPYRPFASQLDSMIALKDVLERAAHMKFTGIISNPNLMAETNEEIIRKGHEKVEFYAREMAIPIRYLAVTRRFYDILMPQYENILTEIKLHLTPPF